MNYTERSSGNPELVGWRPSVWRSLNRGRDAIEHVTSKRDKTEKSLGALTCLGRPAGLSRIANRRSISRAGPEDQPNGLFGETGKLLRVLTELFWDRE